MLKLGSHFFFRFRLRRRQGLRPVWSVELCSEMQGLGRDRERKKDGERKTDRQSESERQEEIESESKYKERERERDGDRKTAEAKRQT